MSSSSLNPLAEAIMFGQANTKEKFLRVATLKPGKTWADVLAAWKGASIGLSHESVVANRAKALSAVVESTTLPDDGF